MPYIISQMETHPKQNIGMLFMSQKCIENKGTFTTSFLNIIGARIIKIVSWNVCLKQTKNISMHVL